MTDTEVFIGRTLTRCRKVAAGAEELMPLLAGVMPFDGEDIDALNLMQRTAATAFLKRFEQLQDLIARAARAIAGWTGVDAGSLTHRDIGDWLEKHALVPDAESWMVAVRLRNRLVHEYPIEEQEQVLRLNESWATMPLLHTITDNLGAYAEQKGLPS
jgi:hypothetical protein